MEQGSFESRLEDLKLDRVHGASELARRSLQILADSAREAGAGDVAELRQLLELQCQRLSASRPTMAPLQNLVDEWRQAMGRCTAAGLADFRHAVADEAEQRIARSRTALQQAGKNCADYIGSGKTVITHSLSSTVVDVFDRLKGRDVQVLVSESRPLNEGRILARQLAEWRIPTQLITDAQMGLFVAQADFALVGADSLLPDGSLVNKAGSYLLALAARQRAVPFCVCCESFKRRKKSMAEPQLEEMESEELGTPAMPGVQVRNVYFDITPAQLISCWIDETGVHQAGSFP